MNMALITKIKTLYSEVVAALGFTPENAANKGQPNGYAGLDAGGRVPASQLPAYVDDVQEFANLAAFPATGAAGIIYLALDTNIIYRWSGSTYVDIASGDVAWSDITGKPTTVSGYGITDAVTLTGVETLTNKTVTDATFSIQDETDNSKKAKFELSGIATATTRTFTLPNVNGTLITDQEYTANNVLTKIKTVDGAGSGLDADLLDGLPLSPEIGSPVWPCIPFITNSGVMEVGRYIDFHASSGEGGDYTARLDAGSATTARVLGLPINGGTLISTGGNGVVSNAMLAQITVANKVANSATTATNNNTGNAIVSRDNSGNFLANFVKFRLAYQGNDAFAVVNTTSTLTGTQLHTLVIESTPTADITLTLPTGTTLEGAVMGSLATNASFTWSIVNIATGFTITLAGNTGSTYTGNTDIAANTSASFRTQKTATNVFKTVRI